MKNKVSNGVNKIIIWCLNIVIIVLSLVLFLMVCVMIGELHDAFDRKRSTDNFAYYMKSEDYHELVPAYYHNTINGFKADEETMEYYGVAQYFEAAFLYNAYVKTGNEEMAQKYKEKMQAAETEMGGWSIAKDSIHKQLGLE